jgi:hypothetical protein
MDPARLPHSRHPLVRLLLASFLENVAGADGAKEGKAAR